MSELAVETHGLRKRFGRKLAVADLSLSVRRGEVFGFLGPNGAGKTTSLKMLLGLVAPSTGRASLLGAPIGDRRARARVGFLPEHFRFQDWLTGRELLRFHGRLFGIPERVLAARAEALLERVSLMDAADRKLREYSKGMLQRIGLAQALVNDPVLVFLDEPTSGLDPLGRRLVRDIIYELRARGTTVFLNSHLLGEVEVTCDRVTFIKEGRTIHELVLGEASAAIEVDLRVGPLDAATRAGLARFGQVVSRIPGDEGRAGPPGGPARVSGERGPAMAGGAGPASVVGAGPASVAGAGPATVAGAGPAMAGGAGPAMVAGAGPASVAGAGPASGGADSPDGLRMRVADDEVLPEIARWLVGRGVALYEMRPARKSLEAWFLEVMGEDQAPG